MISNEKFQLVCRKAASEGDETLN